MKATEQYFPVVLFITLYKMVVVLTFLTTDEILRYMHTDHHYAYHLLFLDFPFPGCSQILGHLHYNQVDLQRMFMLWFNFDFPLFFFSMLTIV